MGACLLMLSTYHSVNHELYEPYPGTEEVITGAEGSLQWPPNAQPF